MGFLTFTMRQKQGMQDWLVKHVSNLQGTHPERKLWLKDRPGYEQNMKKGRQLCTLKCIEEVVFLLLLPPNKGMTTQIHFHTLPRI